MAWLADSCGSGRRRRLSGGLLGEVRSRCWIKHGSGSRVRRLRRTDLRRRRLGRSDRMDRRRGELRADFKCLLPPLLAWGRRLRWRQGFGLIRLRRRRHRRSIRGWHIKRWQECGQCREIGHLKRPALRPQHVVLDRRWGWFGRKRWSLALRIVALVTLNGSCTDGFQLRYHALFATTRDSLRSRLDCFAVCSISTLDGRTVQRQECVEIQVVQRRVHVRLKHCSRPASGRRGG